jgi:threonine dehydrogenase-like Zn-dependent dehydrogenase
VVCGLGPDNITLLPPTIYVRTELQVMGSYAWDRRDIGMLVGLISSGKMDISGSITARFPLEEANTALENLRDKVGKPIRIVVVQD